MLAMWKNGAPYLRLLLLPNNTRNVAAIGTLESGGSSQHPRNVKGKKEEGGRSNRRSGRQTAKSGSSGGDRHRPITMGGLRRLGFLKDPLSAPEVTVNLACGASRKRKEREDPKIKE